MQGAEKIVSYSHQSYPGSLRSGDLAAAVGQRKPKEKWNGWEEGCEKAQKVLS